MKVGKEKPISRGKGAGPHPSKSDKPPTAGLTRDPSRYTPAGRIKPVR
jgi:hypothetical protein